MRVTTSSSNLRQLQGGDPIDFFTKEWDLRLRFKGLGEEVSDDVYLDIILSRLSKAPEFQFIREVHYRTEFTSVDRLQETANRFYVDQQSRNASGPVVSGRRAAMAASSTDQCHRCNCLLYTSPSPRDGLLSRMPSSA